MVNTVKSEENVDLIGKNYMLFDINDDGTTQNDKSDIIMRDENNIYIKYADQNNKYEKINDVHFDTNYYVHEINSPDELWNNNKLEVLNDGYFGVGHNVEIKLADESREVKNFKMQ
jgi:hypothetical protein